MNSGNPVLRESVFKDVTFRGEGTSMASSTMTVQGTMAKTAVLLLAVIAAAAFTYQKTTTGGSAMPWMLGGLLGGLVLGFVISFKPKLAPMLAMPHALLEGLFLGALSGMYALKFPGDTSPIPGTSGSLVFTAVVATFAVTFAMLALYAFRVIKVTEKLRSIVIAATAGIALFYGIAMVLRLFGVDMSFYRTGGIGIAFSLFAIGLAAFNLLIDFDMIERGAKGGAPKFMEWFGGFALIVTLVWLYIELLRLLAILAQNDD